MENENDIIINNDEQLEEDFVETTEVDETEDYSTDWKAIAEAEKARRIRAEQAIAKAKAKKHEQPDERQTIIKQTNTAPNIEETVLRAQGVAQDELDMLKKVSALNGISIIDAQNDEVFKLWKQKHEQDIKAEQAKLGASRGSGQRKPQKDFSTPGLSPEEHKAMWKQKQGQ